ncbi:MAG: hypothetical protein AB8H86_17575 [Polyangiales bacterium]
MAIAQLLGVPRISGLMESPMLKMTLSCLALGIVACDPQLSDPVDASTLDSPRLIDVSAADSQVDAQGPSIVDAASLDGAPFDAGNIMESGIEEKLEGRIYRVRQESDFRLFVRDGAQSGWTCDICPPWVDVSTNGAVSGTVPAIPSEAHYVTLRRAGVNGFEYTSVILVVGDARIVFVGAEEAVRHLHDYVGRTSDHTPVAGDVLVFRDGFFEKSQNDLSNVAGSGAWYWHFLRGTVNARTTLIAEHPMGARFADMTLEALSADNPVEHLALKGLAFDGWLQVNGGGGDGYLNHVIVQQSSAEGFYATNGSTDLLFEDVYALAGGRALYFVGDQVRRAIFRRCIARHSYMDTYEPGASVLIYGRGDNIAQDLLFQNCVFLDRGPEGNFDTSYDFYGAFEWIQGQRTTIQGSVLINLRLSDAPAGNLSEAYFSMNNQDRATGIVFEDTFFGGDNLFRGNAHVNGVAYAPGYGAGGFGIENPRLHRPSLQYGVTGTMFGEPGFDSPTDVPLFPFPNDGIIQELGRDVSIEAGDIDGYENIAFEGDIGFAAADSLSAYLQAAMAD